MTVNDLKVNIINIVTQMSDYHKLLSLYKEATNSKKIIIEENNGFNSGIVNIRKGVSKEQIFEEEGNKTISYAEVQNLQNGIEWNCSLEELLASLD